MRVYLSSTSPRRIEILQKLLVPFNLQLETINPVFMEKENGLPPEKLVLFNARGKLKSVLNLVSDNSLVISADTAVCIAGEILGKPADGKESKKYLQKLSGKTHSVYTGVAVTNKSANIFLEGHEESIVTFKKLSLKEIENYVLTNKPLDKAGAYGIQEIKDLFVEKISGNISNIAGLPETLTLNLLIKAGLKK